MGSGRVSASNALGNSPKPYIQVVNLDVLDSGGNPNGLIDPGETITLDITLHDSVLDATGVTATLSSTDPYVTVMQETGYYGDIPVGGESASSFTFSVSTSAPVGHTLSLLLSITADSGYSVTRLVSLNVCSPARFGWPKGIVPKDITPVDMDGDGRKEVVILYDDSKIAIYDDHGNLYNSNWPKDFAQGTCTKYSNLTFGDVNGDGLMEIVLCADYSGTGAMYGDDKIIDVVDLNGNELPGWPITISNCLFICQAAVADIDPSIPGLEIVTLVRHYITGTQGNYASLDVFTQNGQYLPGFPFLFDSPLGQGKETPSLLEDRGLAIADLDKDGSLEIITGSNSYLYSIDNRANIKPGWPVMIHTEVVSDTRPTNIAVADVDDDGELEIVITGYEVNDICAQGTDRIILLKSNGRYYSDTWRNLYYECDGGGLALGDLDGDGDLEIIFGAGYEADNIYVLDHDGSWCGGGLRPIGGVPACVGAIADLDGDGDLEISASCPSNVSAWHHTGLYLDGADPKVQSSINNNYSYICFSSMADLDANGATELLGGIYDNNGYAYVWDQTSVWKTGTLEWPMPYYNPQRTSYFSGRANAPAGNLLVDHIETSRHTGAPGGPFDPSSVQYTLKNVGSTSSFTWTATPSESWASVSSVTGSLAPGETTTLTVWINSNANNLTADDYTAWVSFKNTACSGSVRRKLALSIKYPALSVDSTDDFNTVGDVGGPFDPQSQTYTLANVGYGTLSWSASNLENWVSIAPASGTLGPKASALVTVSINLNANTLSGGTHSDTVTFTNVTNGYGTTTCSVVLGVRINKIVYVNYAATGPIHDGLSWDTAFLTISEAVDSALDGQEIWVAKEPILNI
ncbi:FG-GAP-like repeat-containing protein [bacterium]|nr:FG-GAP-like repeat-containing protein [bacterium]